MIIFTYSHLGSGNSVRLLEDAQKEGLPITAETCHHYLNLSSNEIPDAAAEFKCCPPVRDEWHQEKLWEAIRKVPTCVYYMNMKKNEYDFFLPGCCVNGCLRPCSLHSGSENYHFQGDFNVCMGRYFFAAIWTTIDVDRRKKKRVHNSGCVATNVFR